MMASGYVGPGGQWIENTPQNAGPTAWMDRQFGASAPIVGVGGAGFLIGDVAIESGSPTLAMETGPTGLPALRVTTGVGANAEIKFPALQSTICGGDAFLSLTGSRTVGNLDIATLYVSQDAAGYAKGWLNNVQYGFTNPLNNPFEQGGPATYWFRRANNSNFGTPTYPAFVADHKLRLTPLGGTSASVLIHGFGFASRQKKGRICVIWDDGYDSMFRLGFDSFASRGIAQTVSVIGSTQGTGSGVSNINQLRAFVNAGGAVVAHGPWGNAGIGNLFTAYTGDPNPASRAVADMQLARDWISQNGLGVPGFARCYVWPQGTWQQTANDPALLNAALSAGFSLARSATNGSGLSLVNVDSLSRYNRLCVPIIGHTWAGTTAAEATNISAITAQIAAAGAQKGDVFLMLHRVLPSTTNDAGMGAAGNITIRHSDLETIAAAIETEITNGTLEAVTMPQMATGEPSLWSSV